MAVPRVSPPITCPATAPITAPVVAPRCSGVMVSQPASTATQAQTSKPFVNEEQSVVFMERSLSDVFHPCGHIQD